MIPIKCIPKNAKLVSIDDCVEVFGMSTIGSIEKTESIP
jgi:hypothetical protein